MQDASQYLIAQCSQASCSCCARASRGICCRRKWAAGRAPLAGGAWTSGIKRAYGNACTKRCWRNCAVEANSIWPGHWSTAPPFRVVRGKKTGPNPTDRRKLGSKHHIIVDAQGIPLAVILTGANRHDVTQLDPLVEAIPPIRGKRGRPLRKPKIVQGDRGYSSEEHRQRFRKRGITPQLAKLRSPHGSGLGKTRWPVERTIAWLHSYRRLKMRYEKYAHIHEAFLTLACALTCWTRLKNMQT